MSGFRNLKDQQNIQFHPGLNFIFGENGAGKSNLLEAIHFFSHSRSFRGALIDQIIKKGQTQFNLYAEIKKENAKTLDNLGIQRNLFSKTLFKINQQKVYKYSDLANQVAIKTLSTDKSNFLDLSPKIRRQEIDWQLFHVKHQNLELFTELSHTLKQKSFLLKKHSLSLSQLTQALEPWNDKLSRLTKTINQIRKGALEELNPEFKELIKLQADKEIENITIDISSGVPKSVDWQDSKQVYFFLCNSIENERRAKQVLYGPQRADLLFFKGNDKLQLAKDYYSRGQKKIISLYFSLAQMKILEKHKKTTVLNLDDLHAELSTKNFFNFIKLLSSQNFQCFITIPVNRFSKMKTYGKTYQIKSGAVREI